MKVRIPLIRRDSSYIAVSTPPATMSVAYCILTRARASRSAPRLKEFFLLVSKQPNVLSSLAYHDYEGIAVRPDEQPRLQNDLGGAIFFMLRNHGLLTVGATVADAFLAMYAFETTCQIQLAAQSSGAKLIPVKPDIIEGVEHAVEAQGLGGSLVWPALIRKLYRIDPSYKQ